MSGRARFRIVAATAVALLGVTLGSRVSTFASDAPDDRDREDRAVAAALREGNRLFRQGDPAAAVDAYLAAGTDRAAGDPVLAYNLATALHRIGRLPEAVAWYRRAGRELSDDPWVTQNLERARAALAAPRSGPPPTLAPLLVHRWMLPAVATATAWIALGLASLPGRRPARRRRVASLLALSALLWAAQLGLDHLGPRPAVLLQPCGASLPAGSEVWVSPGKDPAVGTWTVHGGDGSVQCPSLAVTVL